MEKNFLVFLPFFWVKFLYDYHKAAAWESSNLAIIFFFKETNLRELSAVHSSADPATVAM